MKDYKECLEKATQLNDEGKFGEALKYANQAYKLANEEYPKDYNALMQKKVSLEGLCRKEELNEVKGLIREILWSDTKRRAEGEARKKNHLTKPLIKK